MNAISKSSASTQASPAVQAAPESDPRRCLVVASDGQPTSSLLGYLHDRCSRTAYTFHVVVPCHRRTVLVSDPALSPLSDRNEITVSDREYNADVAEARLHGFLRFLSVLEQPLSGEVESGNLCRKVEHLASLGGYDEILVLTTNQRRRMFGRRRDLAATLRRACEIPVTAVAVIESGA